MIRFFPVADSARFSDDFGAPRSGGRTHQGIDLFNSEGTPLVAVDSGDVHFGTDTLGGNIANVYAQDGTRYYYAHLQGFEGVRRFVTAGETIGYLGRTGNAATTEPHLHFEAHPNNGPAENPFIDLTTAPVISETAAGRSGAQQLARAVLFMGALSGLVWAGVSLFKRSG